MANVTIVPAGQDPTQRSQQMIVKKISQNGQRFVVVNTGQNMSAAAQIAQINKVTPNIVTSTTTQRGGPR